MAEPSNEENPQAFDGLLYAETPEGVAFRENGLRNLEAALLAKQDWGSPQEREQDLAQFYDMAARLRALDAQILARYRPTSSNGEHQS